MSTTGHLALRCPAVITPSRQRFTCGFIRGRAPANARLGWTSNRGSYVPLGAVRPAGGPVPRTLVVVRRRLQASPMLVLLLTQLRVRAWLAGACGLLGCSVPCVHIPMRQLCMLLSIFPVPIPLRATRLLLACGLSHARTCMCKEAHPAFAPMCVTCLASQSCKDKLGQAAAASRGGL